MKFNLHANWKLKTCMMLCALFFGFGTIQAQTLSIKGTVTGDGESLPGVSVLVKGTSNGVVTDFDGNYEIKAKTGDVLLFTYIGFTTQEITVGSNTTIDVVLETDVDTLDEVVVIGYGAIKKKEVTGAVSQIKAEELSRTATADLGTALQGQLAGVNVTASDGAPGSESNIIIRGITTINTNTVTGADNSRVNSSAGNFNSPLYVVDGIPQESDPKLGINEIEKIDVLKDAASAAIYGTRGAAGVILITTKKGKIGEMSVRADSYYAVQKITSFLPRMNTEESLYANFISTAARNGTGFADVFTPIEWGPEQLTNNTNLDDVLYNDYAGLQNHNIGVSGGREGLSYSVNGSFFKQDGILINSGYERFNLRANTQFTKGKWKINTGVSFRVEEQRYTPWQLLNLTAQHKPYAQDLDPNIAEVISPAGPGQQQFASLNRNVRALQQKDTRKGENFTGNISAAYNITSDLKLTLRGSVFYDNNTRVQIWPSFITRDTEGRILPSAERSRIQNLSDRRENLTGEVFLNYNKKFGDHSLALTAALTSEIYEYTYFGAAINDISSNNITVLNGGLNDPDAFSGNNPWNQDRINTLQGSLLRAQYNYKEKYLLSVSARRDGSSRFARVNRFEIFPSISAGWNVSDEEFWEPLKGTINSFKLRGSRGTTGNQNIYDYGFQPTVVLENNAVLGNGTTQVWAPGATQQSFVNTALKWETSISTNFGYDLSFFNNKLTVSADVYSTKKQDMILPLLVPNSIGAGENQTVTLNIGDMTNKGIEYAVNYRHTKGDFSLNIGATYAQNQNIITEMGGTNDIAYLANSQLVTGVAGEDLITVVAEGREAGSFFLYETDGVVKTDAELTEYQQLDPAARLGALRYVDQNGDGQLNQDDKVYRGSGTPDFELGLNLSGNYKNFDFTVQLYGSFGAEVLNGSKASAYKYGTHKDLFFQWSPQNPTSNIPSDTGRDGNNWRGHSDYWLEDGDFVRLRNVTVGYSLPKSLIEKISLSKLRVYFAAQNALTFTKYTGFDPEVGNNGLSLRGIDRGIYPITSQFRAGIQFQF